MSGAGVMPPGAPPLEGQGLYAWRRQGKDYFLAILRQGLASLGLLSLFSKSTLAFAQKHFNHGRLFTKRHNRCGQSDQYEWTRVAHAALHAVLQFAPMSGRR